MVQTVYRDSGAGMPWPMLTKSNYHEWSLLKVKLQVRHLWEAVHIVVGSYDDDRRALEALRCHPHRARRLPRQQGDDK